MIQASAERRKIGPGLHDIAQGFEVGQLHGGSGSGGHCPQAEHLPVRRDWSPDNFTSNMAAPSPAVFAPHFSSLAALLPAFTLTLLSPVHTVSSIRDSHLMPLMPIVGFGISKTERNREQPVGRGDAGCNFPLLVGGALLGHTKAPRAWRRSEIAWGSASRIFGRGQGGEDRARF
jgi:hypothetical protein